LALDIEADAHRMQAWVEATMELNVDQVALAVTKLAREWKTGTPRPAHLIAAAKERRPGDAPQHHEEPVGPFVRLDDMARAMGLDHLSQLADPEMTDEEREIACERYESALAEGRLRVFASLPLVGERH
jgi:hypothetical protein